MQFVNYERIEAYEKESKKVRKIMILSRECHVYNLNSSTEVATIMHNFNAILNCR